MKKRNLKIITSGDEVIFHGEDYSNGWRVGNQLLCNDGTKRRINNISSTGAEVTVVVQSNATSTKIANPVLIEGESAQPAMEPGYAKFKNEVQERQRAIEEQRLALWQLEENLRVHLASCPHHEQVTNKKYHSGDYLNRSYTEKLTSSPP